MNPVTGVLRIGQGEEFMDGCAVAFRSRIDLLAASREHPQPVVLAHLDDLLRAVLVDIPQAEAQYRQFRRKRIGSGGRELSTRPAIAADGAVESALDPLALAQEQIGFRVRNLLAPLGPAHLYQAVKRPVVPDERRELPALELKDHREQLVRSIRGEVELGRAVSVHVGDVEPSEIVRRPAVEAGDLAHPVILEAVDDDLGRRDEDDFVFPVPVHVRHGHPPEGNLVERVAFLAASSTGYALAGEHETLVRRSCARPALAAP